MATANAPVARKHIDVHVHCRDWGESAKATISSVKRLSERQGIVAICDMPNTDPVITTAERVERRLRTAEEQGSLQGYYLYIGATPDQNQVREAAAVASSNPKVVGIKMYAGRSVGNLPVTELEDQRNIYFTLAKENYKGILAVHCEDERYARYDLWQPEKPATWNLAKPPVMEMAAVTKQIEFALESKFEGHLHICHITIPHAVRAVDMLREKMRISCGVTPHHLMLSTKDMETEDGIKFKVNPPLRDPITVAGMNLLLRNGRIDWIETDHAPHMPEEKTYDAQKPKNFFMSGIRSLELYGTLLEKLASRGFPQSQIDDLTYNNIKKVFTKIVE